MVESGLNSHHLVSEFALKSHHPDCLSISSEKKKEREMLGETGELQRRR